MNDIAVRVENLGKLYRIGQIVGYGTLRESLMNVVTSPFRHRRSARHDLQATGPQSDYIWALKDVSFEIKRGEAVGIIGRNGSGKSTLLKIVSRITAPTEGHVEIHGRVGSLLEVGTGFHPELTGRENIYLNGAVIGMKRAEVKRKFDEIVAFSEIEKFLDTPVKRYSSGMYVRLAFAVAAHLDPDILVIDEVLAVGDAAFQKKCLGKMEGAAQEGRTVVFVSHNMPAVRSLCQRCVILDTGHIQFQGDTNECIGTYLGDAFKSDATHVDTSSMPRPGNISADSPLRITSVSIGTANSVGLVYTDEDLIVTMEFLCIRGIPNIGWGFYIESLDYQILLDLKSIASLHPVSISESGHYRITGSVSAKYLAPGRYFLGVGARNDDRGLDWLPRAMKFTVHDRGHSSLEKLWFSHTASVIRNIGSSWQLPVRTGQLEDR